MMYVNSSHCYKFNNFKSPKSSDGDEDTEIMMDELLMSNSFDPMMTSSNIRGLLPRYNLAQFTNIFFEHNLIC